MPGGSIGWDVSFGSLGFEQPGHQVQSTPPLARRPLGVELLLREQMGERGLVATAKGETGGLDFEEGVNLRIPEPVPVGG